MNEEMSNKYKEAIDSINESHNKCVQFHNFLCDTIEKYNKENNIDIENTIQTQSLLTDEIDRAMNYLELTKNRLYAMYRLTYYKTKKEDEKQ